MAFQRIFSGLFVQLSLHFLYIFVGWIHRNTVQLNCRYNGAIKFGATHYYDKLKYCTIKATQSVL